jgi:hypothetical protein
MVGVISLKNIVPDQSIARYVCLCTHVSALNPLTDSAAKCKFRAVYPLLLLSYQDVSYVHASHLEADCHCASQCYVAQF